MWFKHKNCTNLTIKEFDKMGDDKPSKVKTVEGKDKITELISLIESLPVEGDIFKKWADDVPMIVLEFNCTPTPEHVMFFRKSIQTPGTSFFSPSLENERRVYEKVKELLAQ